MTEKILVDYIIDVEITKQEYLTCKTMCEPNEETEELEIKRLAYIQAVENMELYIDNNRYLQCIKLLKRINYI